jgi:8-oxo-dGTP diphosphatase
MKNNVNMKAPKIGLGVLILKRNMLLLGKRIDGHGKNTWQSAGGHLEFGESFKTCAQREIKEEIGIKVKNIKFVTATNDVFEKENKHYVTIFMVCEYVSGEPTTLEPTKCKEWRWFDKNKLPESLFLPYDQILKKV